MPKSSDNKAVMVKIKDLSNEQKNNLPSRWSCWIHRIHLWREVRPPDTTNECPRYDTKQSDGEVPVMLELWGMQSTPFIAITPRSTLAQSGSSW